MGNIIRTTEHTNPPADLEDANRLIDNALATCMHATRCAVSKALQQNSPGAIVFRRDMFMDIPLIADLLTIRNKRQAIVDENLRRQNRKRREHDYAVNDKVWLHQKSPDKLQERLIGPYTITRVYTNGTVEIRRPPNYLERVNIRRLTPNRDTE